MAEQSTLKFVQKLTMEIKLFCLPAMGMVQVMLLLGVTILHFTFMYLADTFIQSDLQCIIHGYTFFFISMCVPWELNPQPLRC